MTLTKLCKLAVLATLLNAPAFAADTESQLYRSVARDLPSYVRDVDMSLLSTSQLAALNNIINGSDSRGKKIALMKSIIRRSINNAANAASE